MGTGEDGQDSVGRHGTAWNGMDACTRCGEAIPVVWARNTDDPSGQTHPRTHSHTHPHTHTSPTSHKAPPDTTDHQSGPRPDARPCYTLDDRLLCNNPDRHHLSITTTTTLHPPPPTSSRTSNTVSLTTRWRLHDDPGIIGNTCGSGSLDDSQPGLATQRPKNPEAGRAHSSAATHGIRHHASSPI